jgi:hypothetical protein
MNYKNDKYARYSSGTVVENLNISPKRKEKRIVETIRKSDFDSSLSDDSTSTGNDLRKNRNKDLKTVKRDQPKVLRPIGKVSNWNQTDIDLVITSLNLSYGDKSREELTATQRVGLINWVDFNKFVSIDKEGYEEDERLQHKFTTWTAYHVKKGDIKFLFDKWIWKPRKF